MLNAVNIFALALILSGVISLLLCWYIFQKLTGGVRFFATIMLGIAVWAIGYGIELNCSTLGDMQFWSNVQCLGISFLPLFWIIFVIKFIGKNNWLTIPLVVLLFIEPV